MRCSIIVYYATEVYETHSKMNTKKNWDLNIPRWLAPIIFLCIGFVVLILGIGSLWIASGYSNPPVGQRVTWQDKTWASKLEMNEIAWATSSIPLPEDFTIDVTGTISAESDPSAAWGVWVKTSAGSIILYAINGEGYTTTRVCPNRAVILEDCPPLQPGWRWIEYNRLHGPGQNNTITLHRETPEDIRLRLNHELWGITPVDTSGIWGVWARGGRDRSAQFTWH
jgi:hypothetical protein